MDLLSSVRINGEEAAAVQKGVVGTRDCDAAVVGTYFKENGKLENEKLENVRVDAHRVREFMAVVKALREQR